MRDSPPADSGRSARVSIAVEAVEQVFERLRPRLLAFVRARGLDSAAEDVVQETLLAALTTLRHEGLQGVSSLEHWLYGILRHKLVDYFRENQRFQDKLVSLQRFDAVGDAPLPPALQAKFDPHVVLLVRQALERLPPRHWLVLMLNQRLGLTTGQMAPVVGRSPGRVGAILAEAKEMFRREVRGEEDS